MHARHLSRLTAALGCAAALASYGCSSTATTQLPPQTSPAARAHPDQLLLWYNNGPVLTAPKLYLIFWGYKKYGDPNKVQSLLESYAQNIGGSAHNNIYTQYYETVKGKNVYITNPKNQYGGVWSDESAVPRSPTDQQVANEALKALAHLKYDPNGVYLVATPHGHSMQGFPTNWCAYHSYTYYKKNDLLAYINFPYTPDSDGCGKNAIKAPSDESGDDEGVTIMAGDEYGEAITDPQPFSGWRGVDGEIGDDCAWHNLANDKFGAKRYTMQPELSDATHTCVQTYK
ncbi:MAG TPA: hypothetical protein VHX17_05360 [Candidatus Cybelea sp.]|jgi:serine protease|nr:hypothetical protein [Candidatus Cybelea sp.]